MAWALLLAHCDVLQPELPLSGMAIVFGATKLLEVRRQPSPHRWPRAALVLLVGGVLVIAVRALTGTIGCRN